MIHYYKEPLGWAVESDAFDSQTLAKCEAIFAQSNGYMGIRAAVEERYIGERRNAFVTGTFNCADPAEVTELPNLPDVTCMELFVNSERFHLDSGTLHCYNHRLNLKTGEVTREVEWTSPAGVKLILRFGRVVSLANEHVTASYMEVTPVNADVKVKLDSGIDGRVTNTGSQHLAEGERRLLNGNVLRLVTATSQSGVQIAVHCAHHIEGAALKCLPVMGRRSFVNRYTGTLCANQTLRVEKLSCYHSGRDMESDNSVADVCERGRACIEAVMQQSYAQIAAESAAAWDAYWQIHDMQIDSVDSYDQLAMRYALWQLNGMVKRNDNRVGIGAKALTGEGYKGHSFWDTELFILPHYQFTDPDTARTLLEYRWKSLPGARKKAASNNYVGAMYPWESAWLDDGEVTPLWGAADIQTGESIPILTGMIEHHITADVAWSVWQYYKATGDEDFMECCGCEILLDTARYWLSRADYNAELDRFELLDVIGPDEYKEHVSNNAYTNYLAHANLRFARQILDIMPEKWPETAQRMTEKLELAGLAQRLDDAMAKWYLPQPNEDQILPQNDQYLRLNEIDLSKYKQESGVSTIYDDYGQEQINQSMVSKQADTVMLLCVMSDRFSEEVCRKSFDFYEAHTLHDSSLSYGTHGLLASRLGVTELAYKMFRHARDIDLGPNMTSSVEGIHSASMGGLWQCAALGFAGLRQEEDKLYLAPQLPKEWSRLAFRFVWQGCPVLLEATHENLKLRNIGAKPVELHLGNETLVVVSGEEVQHVLKEADMKFEAIIFDLDGVLCSTDHLHYLGWKKLADREGIYFDEVINQRLRGVSRMESLNIVLERADKTYSDEQKLEMAIYKNDQYRLLLNTLTPADLSGEVKTTLEKLREMGVQLAVGSSSKNTKLILEKLGLGSFFDAIADGNDIKNSKPDPEVFLLAAQRLGKPQENCLVVEDAKAGILAACRGSFRSAGIGPASADPNATYSLHTFSDLISVINS